MKRVLVIIYTLVFSILLAQIYDRETIKDMPFVASNKKCKKCHTKPEDVEKIKNPARADNAFCQGCHEEQTDITKKHHPVGKRLRDEIKYFFDLTEKNKIACFTCHNLNNRRYDVVSWRSESLFEKMFGGKEKYRTYFLIMKNDEGQLCRKCHI